MSNILNIPELGELEIVEIYDYFNVPILFSCRNAVPHLYIVLFADYLPEYETWLYVEVSPMRLNLIRSGKVNLHDAFSKPEMGCLLKAMIPHNNSGELNSEYITPDQLHSDVFPPVNEYLNLGDTPLFSETNLVEIAKSSGREIIGLNFNFIEEYNSEAPILPLGKTLIHLQNVINTIRMVRSKSKKINEEIRNSMQLSILAIQPGSFDIKLAFKKENAMLIEDIPSIQGEIISEFLNLLRSKDSESDLKDILKRLQSKVAEEYKKLLTSLSESGADTTFSWASPKSDEQETVSLSKNEIPKLIEILQTFQEEQETPFTVTGELIGLFLSSKRFEIKTENDTYKGFILKDADSSIKNATMSRRYKAQIKEILNKSEATDEVVKTEYLLLKLEEINY
jgi:hypothetical protein